MGLHANTYVANSGLEVRFEYPLPLSTLTDAGRCHGHQTLELDLHARAHVISTRILHARGHTVSPRAGAQRTLSPRGGYEHAPECLGQEHATRMRELPVEIYTFAEELPPQGRLPASSREFLPSLLKNQCVPNDHLCFSKNVNLFFFY